MGIRDRIMNIKNRGKKPQGRKHGKLGKVILVILLALFALGGLAGFLTDMLWFNDLGYSDVFWKKIVTRIEIGVPLFIITALLARLYLKSLKNGYFKEVESREIPDVHKLNILSWVLSVVLGLLAAIPVSGMIWMQLLQFTNASDFNLKDPLFNLDISFYVFKLDFLEVVNGIVIGILGGLVFVTLFYYAVLMTVRTPDILEREPGRGFDDEGDVYNDNPYRDIGGIPFGRGRMRPEDAAKRVKNFMGGSSSRSRQLNRGNLSHLFNIASGKITILGVAFYVMLLVHFLLKQFNLLHAHTGAVYGAGFTDVNVTLWVYRLIMLLSVAGAVTFAVHMKKREYRKLIKMPIAIAAIILIGTGAEFTVQNLVVSPDEINKETKYLESNITYTRHAYGLDKIDVQPFAANDSLSGENIVNNTQTIGNIRINDYEPVQDFYNQTQSIRQYYDFNDVDIDRYMINGAETQTYLAAREINEKKISSTWLNRHIKYTHGYGVTLSQVDAVTASGQPDVIVKNIPPESSVKEINIERPEIYFGESTNNYIIVNTDEKEFDYPDGNNNKYTRYKADSGVKMNLASRILFSIREKSIQLLVSSNVNSDSRIIVNRNVEDRVKTIMPYLTYDKDPYMTTTGGRLYWVIDAYTTSANYPYSEPQTGEVNTTNYIRNSIKVVIDAYTGDVRYYIVDDDDPIAMTYQKIYPKLFKNMDEMPKGLREHIRYPNTLFKIQANVYTKYHMNETRVFYQKEDLWDISKQIYGTSEKKMDPSYYIFKLPSEEKAEFINMVPFTPKSKQNMTAVIMARNDGDNYGKLVVYKFPKNKTVYGPMQVEAQIDQNTEISKEFSLWNSTGSSYRRGDMFVIPIDDSILYVEPVYLEASNQAIPEVKRVIVAYGDRIAYQPTLAAALDELFGEGTSIGASGAGHLAEIGGAEEGKAGKAPDSLKDLAAKAQEAYDAAVQSQKDGDWKGYGDHLKELEGYLSRMAGAAN